MELGLQDQYKAIMHEIRVRIIAAEKLSEYNDAIFIESVSLQIRKTLELLAYLTLLLNRDKVNNKTRDEYHAKKIIEALSQKTSIFYPFPSHIFPPSNKDDQPLLIPLGYGNALTQTEFKCSYQKLGKILHAQHPLKHIVDIEEFKLDNNKTIEKLKNLLRSHTIGVRYDSNKYTFLHTNIDFTHDETASQTVIREYNTHIFSEEQLINIFNPEENS